MQLIHLQYAVDTPTIFSWYTYKYSFKVFALNINQSQLDNAMSHLISTPDKNTNQKLSKDRKRLDTTQ